MTMAAERSPARGSKSGFWHAAWYRYRRNRLALVSGVIAVIIVLVAALAPLIAPYGYAAQDLSQSLVGPSLHHLLGTDELGRDLLSRAIYGAQTSMTIAVGAPLVGALIGIPIGIASGWFGGLVDAITLRAFEIFTMVPQILLALLLIALFGSGVLKLLLFLGVTAWVGFARLARAQYIALRDRDFVVAARAMGVPTWRIITVHVLPSAVGPLIVFFVQQIPATIFAAAGFSFLGLGVQDPTADWGKMINDGQQYLTISLTVALLPIVCIALATLTFSFAGDGLRDALDPTSR
ncbi:oligopeptide transport system permease protein [Actinopolymorpha cephalotaxi]|uniref:Oligopeptide transport system permease protein OppC n=1 Tax=Actinopolymorpha cephalotaxi TaxID=504797 RepID=A0A1I2WTP5_9ACTN|nr:ABC transporter permease [Actinopolymorpha cephalotaxi]NYH85098.1 ABC-type dipeptide/oligopeptide/nickel transport system permease subunit [Actinopolymorpha cephalotaxi]SFH04067.1 oligopeptide transport system permease protein [Actinopolymorpha cephalotaxi]